VALIDLGLPGLDGLELARRIRASPDARGMRLVALTGYGSTADRARCRAAGFDVHLVKPVDRETLERVLAGS
jgi:two-component system, sensor histidine kinase